MVVWLSYGHLMMLVTPEFGITDKTFELRKKNKKKQLSAIK